MSASPARPKRRGVVLFGAWMTVACGARDGFGLPENTPPPTRSHGMAGGGGSAREDPAPTPRPDATAPAVPEASTRDDAALDAASTPDGTATRDGATDLDATTPSDDAADASVAPASDAAALPDCSCPADDYFVDVNVDGVVARLTEPLRLTLYCAETAPAIAKTPCGSLYTLSACAKPDSGPPCLYLAVDLVRGPVIGHYEDATGQTWYLNSASLSPDRTSGRLTTGSFAATFARPGDAGILSAYGTFGACTTRMPVCSR